jgi:hypothetical protein
MSGTTDDVDPSATNVALPPRLLRTNSAPLLAGTPALTTGSTLTPVRPTGSATGSLAPVVTTAIGSPAPIIPPGSISAPMTMTGNLPTPALSPLSAVPSMRLTARTITELQSSTSLYTTDIIKRKHATRGTKESMQWVSIVTTGIDSKLSMVKNDAIASDQLESVYDLAMRVTEIKNMAKKNGLLDAFDIYQVDSIGRPLKTTARNLLDEYGTITFDEVRTSTRSVQSWDPDHRVWVETIVATLIANCCDAPLRERVTERLIGVDPYETGGATYFKSAIDCITSMSQTVSMALSIRLSTLTIKGFDGENVPRVISFLRGATQRLKMSNMLPPHLSLMVYRILQSSSCIPFNAFFAALYAREEADVMIYGPTKRLTAEQLYMMADGQYRMFLEASTWTVSGKKPSAFTTEAGARPLPPWKLPPKTGEPHDCEFKGRPEYWCGRGCGWNRTHSGPGHKTKEELREYRANANRQNNQTNNNSTTNTANPAESNRTALEGHTAATATTTITDNTTTTMNATAAANATFLQTGSRS